MQCKHIPTLPILQHIALHGGIGCTWIFGDERDVRHAMPNGFAIPEKLVFAKMNQLISNGTIDGCSCGCRGDYSLTDKGEAMLNQ